MKQSLIYVLSLGFLSLLLDPVAARATDGTITFQGEVKDESCVTSINGAVGSDGTVSIAKISKGSLSKKGEIAMPTPFLVKLTDCPTTLSKAHVHFSRSDANIDMTTGYLKNTASQGPSMVELELLDGQNNNSVIDLRTGTQETSSNAQVSGTHKEVDLRYFVQYIATAAATPGLVASSIQYDIVYE